MAKKDKVKEQERQLVEQVSESANDIWLAGLAAFEKAQREGTKVFSKLVKEGKKVESRTLEVAGHQLEEIKNRASGTWDKLEHLFEARVQRALDSLGVPTRHEVRDLAEKVDNLSESGESTGEKKTVAKPKRGTRKAAPAKPDVVEGPDDLKKIKGIGPALERKLNDYGVTSYRQIAGWTSKDVEDIETNVIRFSGRVSRDDWIAQAKAAQKEKYGK